MNRQPFYVTYSERHSSKIVCFLCQKIFFCEVGFMRVICPSPRKSRCTAYRCSDWVVISATACILATELLCVHGFIAGGILKPEGSRLLCTHSVYTWHLFLSCYVTCDCVNLHSVIDKTFTEVNSLSSLSRCVIPITHAWMFIKGLFAMENVLMVDWYRGYGATTPCAPRPWASRPFVRRHLVPSIIPRGTVCQATPETSVSEERKQTRNVRII
jgi:hypothetical protein